MYATPSVLYNNVRNVHNYEHLFYKVDLINTKANPIHSNH